MNARPGIRISRGAALAGLLLAAPAPVQSSAEDGGELIFLCPFSVLQEAYANLTQPTEALALLAIERHVLGICRESQTLLLEIHQNNRRLRELFASTISDTENASRSATATESAPFAAEGAMPGDSSSGESDGQDVSGRTLPVELLAVTRRADGTAGAVLRVDGQVLRARDGQRLESGIRVAAIGDRHVLVTAPDGTEHRID